MKQEVSTIYDIATDFRGPLIVASGPGSGKTSCLLLRGHYLTDIIDSLGKVIICTFSRDAANYIKDKYYKIFKKEFEGTISTISKLGCDLIKIWASSLLKENRYSIYYKRLEDVFAFNSEENLRGLFLEYIKKSVSNTTDVREIDKLGEDINGLINSIYMSTHYLVLDKLKKFNNIEKIICSRPVVDRDLSQSIYEKLSALLSKNESRSNEYMKHIDTFHRWGEIFAQSGMHEPWSRLSAYYFMFMTHYMPIEKKRLYIDIGLSPIWAARLLMSPEQEGNLVQLINRRYCRLMIDEFQDVNIGDTLLTINFIKAIRGQVDIFYDLNQSIFNFRGALGAAAVDTVQHTLEELNISYIEYILKRNMRSHLHIVSLANLYLKHTKGEERTQEYWSEWPRNANYRPLFIQTNQVNSILHIEKIIKSIRSNGGEGEKICILCDDEQRRGKIKSHLVNKGIFCKENPYPLTSHIVYAMMGALYMVYGYQDRRYSFDLVAHLIEELLKIEFNRKELSYAQGLLPDIIRMLYINEVKLKYIDNELTEEKAMDALVELIRDKLIKGIVGDNQASTERQTVDDLVQRVRENLHERMSNLTTIINEYNIRKDEMEVIEKIIKNVVIFEEGVDIHSWLKECKRYWQYRTTTPPRLPTETARDVRTFLDSLASALYHLNTQRPKDCGLEFIINRLLSDLGLMGENAVTITNIARSKGLEYDIILLVIEKPIKSVNDQYINNYYVALTRAKKWLVMVWVPEKDTERQYYAITGKQTNSHTDLNLKGLPENIISFINEAYKKNMIIAVIDKDTNETIRKIEGIASEYMTFSAQCDASAPNMPPAHVIGQHMRNASEAKADLVR